MSPEFNLSQKLFPDLPDEFEPREVSRILRISRTALRDWEKKGILTPVKGAYPHTFTLFSQAQFGRAGVVKLLRSEGWDFPEIRSELTKPGYLEGHMDLLRELIAQDRSETSQ